jgi:4-aminobutyrate aminotransferase-like enzyme
VVKLCNAGEGMTSAACQAAALQHIATVDPSLPVPRVQPSLAGVALAMVQAGGIDYPLLVLSWCAGDVIGKAALTAEQYFAWGEMIGRLNKALRGFRHHAPAARDLPWDTAQAHKMFQSADLHPLPAVVTAAAREFQNEILPRLAHLPAQIMHADVHPYNTVMDEAGHITGIIDFGDMIHAPRVIELSNALADALVPGADHAEVISNMVQGFVRHVHLEDAEVDLVLPLMRTRLALTAVITAQHRANDGHITPQIAALDQQAALVLHSLSGHALGPSIRYAAHIPTPVMASDHILQRRQHAMGPKPLLFYDEPLHMERGEGVWLIARDGRRYLDCYNNVAHVGHSHPHVVEAVTRQLRILNTNTRYLTAQAIAYAEELKATLDPSLDTVIFVNSGSEANDVAFRMAKVWTGDHGLLIMDHAYHGVTDASDAMSPSNYPPGTFHKTHVRQLEAPDTYRGPWRRGEDAIAEKYAGLADAEIAALNDSGHGLAMAVIDSAFMTNGIIDAPPDYVGAIAAKVRHAGGLFVADEVQSGFGRMGTHMWGHQHHGSVPDMVTIGKPAGNGYPLGAIITRAEILARFTAETGPFFSTFGGGNAACAAGLAVLEVMAKERLQDNALSTGQYLRNALLALMPRHPLIGDVRGSGLAIGVELVLDHLTRAPAPRETRTIINRLKEAGILVGTDGKWGNVLKIRPPLVFTPRHADRLVAALDNILKSLR